MHALRACFYHATQVFLLDLSHDLTRYVCLWTLSDGKLTSLKYPTMADSWINTEIMIILLHKTHCLQELDMSNSSEVHDNICEVIMLRLFLNKELYQVHSAIPDFSIGIM